MTIFQKAKLGDVTTKIGSGATPRGGKGVYHQYGIPLIRSLNVYDLVFNYNDLAFIDEKQAKKLDNVAVEKDDVLLNITGASVCRCTSVPQELVPARVNQHVSIIRADKKRLAGNYLKYVLVSSLYKRELYGLARTGVTREALTKYDIENFEVSLPDLPTQTHIASILSAYDDLIENNKKRIKVLEEMAQLLYTEWFVKFKFPGHEKVKLIDSGTEYGMIPEGWEVKNVESLIKRIQVGKKYDNKNVLEIGKIPVLDQGKSGFIGYHNDEPGVKASIENPVIVFANHTCYQNIIIYPFSTIQNVLPFIPNDERNIFWLHWATKDLIKLNDYKGHWPEFMSKKLVIPTIELTKEFGIIVGKYVAMKYKLELENKNLSQTRNLLIPQLVTGRRELR